MLNQEGEAEIETEGLIEASFNFRQPQATRPEANQTPSGAICDISSVRLKSYQSYKMLSYS